MNQAADNEIWAPNLLGDEPDAHKADGQVAHEQEEDRPIIQPQAECWWCWWRWQFLSWLGKSTKSTSQR